MKINERLSALSIYFMLFINSVGFSQKQAFRFREFLEKSPNQLTTFCLPNSSSTVDLLSNEKITIKYSTKNWIHITTTPQWIADKTNSKELSNFYFEFAPPALMSDSALHLFQVDDVHMGLGDLTRPYTGKNIIVGIVDQGIDWNHPDFIDENGNTRVLRYWDHSTSIGGTIPQPYNYGIVWDDEAINNGICISTEESTAHGSTVAGMATGNGAANGRNKGMAPDANIIIVETNFNLQNWTLSIADACDYIFKVADSLNMPAVINLSLGSYLGSHDGNDPAAEYMEQLLDEKKGRVIVCAAGNSGQKGKYHVHGDVDADTSFVWIKNNPNSNAQLGPNKIYFDLWSDLSDANFQFAYGADLPAPTYGMRGQTEFNQALTLSSSPFYDTIYNASGNRIATIETYTEIVNGNFHLEGYFSNIDSVNYLFRFMTTGQGSYDMWSGAWMGLNDFVVDIPSTAILPSIIHYNIPDSLQTIVSSWNCSEKVISVGNVRNRIGHIDKNGNFFTPTDQTPVGHISPGSSKGPNRHLVTKPDICASGDVTLAAGPIWLLNNPANNGLIDQGGWHVRNGGTSMASPVIAGIAALYLEKCDRATYADFKEDLFATAMGDQYTGTLPNNAYGHGKPNALALLERNFFSADISGNTVHCNDPVPLNAFSDTTLSTVIWSDGFEGFVNNVNYAGIYFADAYNLNGCKARTDTIFVEQMDPFPILPISQSGNTLASLSLTNYQWTLNGVDIPGANGPILEIFPPYGTYTCYCISPMGCRSETQPYTPFMGTQIIENDIFRLYPNPTSNVLRIESKIEAYNIQTFTNEGKEVLLDEISPNTYSLEHLQAGIYHIILKTNKHVLNTKVIKM